MKEIKVLQNRLKQLMLKKHKTVEQVSQETGIKKGSLEMYNRKKYYD